MSWRERARALEVERDTALSMMRVKEAEAAAATMRANKAEEQLAGFVSGEVKFHITNDEAAGVAMLRRLRGRIVNQWEIETEAAKRHATDSNERRLHRAQADIWSNACTEIDRLIAEVEKPADPPKDREGDAVLQEALQHDTYDRTPFGRALKELCRRALGEER